MIPQAFEYSAPASLEEALALLADGNAKVLAGGMSLIPLMKLRLAAPEHVVDLRRVPGLNQIREQGGQLRIGAMVTHYGIESSPVVRERCPLLGAVAAHIGDVQVRNMGTIGGSVAHADPAADYPAALMALEARVRLARNGSERSVSFEEFVVDTLTTALETGEIVTAIDVAVESAGTSVAYQKMVQPASGFAIVGAAVRLRRSGNGIGFARIGITGLAAKAFRAEQAERVLVETGDARGAAAVVAEGVECNSDLHASADYRRHMAAVYTARAIEQALARTA